MKERRTSVLHDLAGLSFDVELMSEFDAAGNRTDLKALVNGTADFWNEYLYDNLHRTTSIEQHGAAGGSTVAEKRIDFAYDAASQWDTITRYANLLGTQLVAESTYAFDDAGRLVSLAHAKGTSVFADYAWTYDAANRITAFTNGVHASENVTYAYDDADQLTGADRSGSTNDETYSYDANGNRTNTGYATGDGNLLESDGVFDYEYDDEGNRAKRTSSTPWCGPIQMPRVNLLIADDVGLGKTIEAGMAALQLFVRHRAKKILAICPSALQIQ
jgi:YD repeat-containing protein